jgi:hypothetical protein
MFLERASKHACPAASRSASVWRNYTREHAAGIICSFRPFHPEQMHSQHQLPSDRTDLGLARLTPKFEIRLSYADGTLNLQLRTDTANVLIWMYQRIYTV